MLSRKRFEKIAQKKLAFIPPKPPFSKPRLLLSAVKNTMRLQRAANASVGQPKIAESLGKSYPAYIAWELRTLGEIKIPKELSPKQRKKFRKTKKHEFYRLRAQQAKTKRRFKKNIYPALYKSAFNPVKGQELSSQFNKEPAAEKIEKIIHAFVRKNSLKAIEIQTKGKQAIVIPELEMAANKIVELVLTPPFRAEVEKLKDRTETRNTE